MPQIKDNGLNFSRYGFVKKFDQLKLQYFFKYICTERLVKTQLFIVTSV